MEYEFPVDKSLSIGAYAALVNAEINALVMMAAGVPLTQLPHAEMIKLVAPGNPGFSFVTVAAFTVVQGLVFTFALAVALYAERRWSRWSTVRVRRRCRSSSD
jgi:hypothetical protein